MFNRKISIAACLLGAYAAFIVYCAQEIPQSYAQVVNPGLQGNTGRPFCDVQSVGATGNGVTDDDTAFNTCLSTLIALSPTTGGIINVPPGHYCLQNGTFNAALAASTASIIINGAGSGGNVQQSILDTCGADVDLIKFTKGGSAINNIRLRGAPFTLNSAHNGLTIGCSECKAYNISTIGGFWSLFATSAASDWVVEASNISNSYGSAFFEIQGGGGAGYLKRVKVDTAATCASNPTAWVATSSVSANQCVTTGGYIIRYSVGGTTGGSAPTLLAYGSNFTDGSATASLLVPVNAFGLELSNAGVYTEQSDFSGPFNYGIHVTNASSFLYSTGDTSGQTINGSFLIDGGGASIINGQFNGCLGATCKIINVSGLANGLSVSSGTNIAGGPTGIEYDTGTYLNVTDARIGATTTGINIGTANLSNISIIGNQFGTNAQTLSTAIAFTNGTSDFVSVLGNTFQYTTTTFTGTITGTHNRIETNGNEASVSLTLSNPTPLRGSLEQGMTLLNVLTASNSASLSDTTHFTSTYDDYIIVIDNLVPVTNQSEPQLQLTCNGSLQNTGYLNTTGGATTYISLTAGAATVFNGTGTGYTGSWLLSNINSTSVNKVLSQFSRSFWYTAAGTISNGSNGSGTWNGGQQACSGITIVYAAGVSNILTGIVKIFGIRNAL